MCRVSVRHGTLMQLRDSSRSDDQFIEEILCDKTLEKLLLRPDELTVDQAVVIVLQKTEESGFPVQLAQTQGSRKLAVALARTNPGPKIVLHGDMQKLP